MEEDLLGSENKLLATFSFQLWCFQGYGGGVLYDGQYTVNKTNVILVTINYRIGALGFLVYGSKQEIGGNYGLKVYVIVIWHNTT